MASTASSSRAERTGEREAGPLPLKVGELGYPALQSVSEEDITEGAGSGNDSVHMPTTSPSDPAPAASQSSHAPSTAAASTASLASTVTPPPKRSGFFARLTSSRAPPLFWGLQGPSVIRFTIICILLAGTITGWALVAQQMNKAKSPPDHDNSSSLASMAGTMGIFVHVAFAVGLLIELVFVERAVFQLRAERWRHNHPGETLPLHRGGAGVSAGGMNIAPWNRPPLPTYAAALGFRGTGDVEDEVIAPPPPPAYGNTRGSVLLLASALRRISGGARTASLQFSPRTPRMQQIPDTRPASYVSATEDAEVRSDAERARQLEQALASLERSSSDRGAH